MTPSRVGLPAAPRHGGSVESSPLDRLDTVRSLDANELVEHGGQHFDRIELERQNGFSLFACQRASWMTCAGFLKIGAPLTLRPNTPSFPRGLDGRQNANGASDSDRG